MASDQTSVGIDARETAGGFGAVDVGAKPMPNVTLADLDVDPEFERLRFATLSARIRLSLTDMRRAVRMLLDENPDEARLLFYVLMSDVIFLLNFGLKFVISPSGAALKSEVPAEFAGAIGGLLVLCFLVRTASLYVFSAVVAGGCRLLGGQGSWRDTRAGVFWASLVAAPVGVLGALAVTGLDYLETLHPSLSTLTTVLYMPAQLIGVVAFVFFVAAAVSEAHRFRATSPVFIAFSVLTVAILLVALYAGQQVVGALA
ncbi:MAG: YIP1 family protein [Paracoccaceae bacterium]